MPAKLIDPYLSYTDMSEEQLYGMWKAYYPSGSGPLGLLRTIAALVESIAHVKGYDVSKWPTK